MTGKPAFDVIVCGSLHLDIIVKANALPRIDETAVGSGWAQVCGGKGGNQAVQAARAGARTAMIGRVGADGFGETLRKNLQLEHVDLSCVATDQLAGSGMSVAILQSNGDYGAVIVSGANLAIDPADMSRQWAALGGAKVLVLQNEVPQGVNVAAAGAAKENGAKVVLNAAPARLLDVDLLGLADVLVVNRVEAEMMAGRPVSDRASARAALPALSAAGRSVVITLGGDGLVVGSGADVTEIAALPVTVISTHGAGDCFVGKLAAEIAAGAELVAACRSANARAAAFVSGG
jgi:ribokinase